MTGPFRRPLFFRLLGSFLLSEAGATCMIQWEKQLGALRMPVNLVILGAGCYFLKLLLETGWYDTTASELERKVCRWLIWLQLAVIVILLIVKLPGILRLS